MNINVEERLFYGRRLIYRSHTLDFKKTKIFKENKDIEIEGCFLSLFYSLIKENGEETTIIFPNILLPFEKDFSPFTENPLKDIFPDLELERKACPFSGLIFPIEEKKCFMEIPMDYFKFLFTFGDYYGLQKEKYFYMIFGKGEN